MKRSRGQCPTKTLGTHNHIEVKPNWIVSDLEVMLEWSMNGRGGEGELRLISNDDMSALACADHGPSGSTEWGMVFRQAEWLDAVASNHCPSRNPALDAVAGRLLLKPPHALAPLVLQDLRTSRATSHSPTLFPPSPQPIQEIEVTSKWNRSDTAVTKLKSDTRATHCAAHHFEMDSIFLFGIINYFAHAIMNTNV